MALCLLAWQRRGTPPPGYRSLSLYAELGLQLSGKKMGRLLAAARAFEHLPIFSDAFREGRIEWAKVRELQSLITPETEHDWLDYAQRHTAAQVARKVALSPRAWKRQQALLASLNGHPIADSATVRDILQRDDEGPGVPSLLNNPPSAQSTTAGVQSPSVSGPGHGDQTGKVEAGGPAEVAGSSTTRIPMIRLSVDMTPDQFAAYEVGRRILEARARRRLMRGEVFMHMAEVVIDSAPARIRAKHQILIHTVEGRDGGWYETDRGMLPVDPQLLDFVKENGPPPIVVPGDLAGFVNGDPPRGNTSQDGSPQTESPRGKSSQDKSQQTESPRGKSSQDGSPQAESPRGKSPQGKPPQTESPRGKSSQGKPPQTECPSGTSSQAEPPQEKSTSSAPTRVGSEPASVAATTCYGMVDAHSGASRTGTEVTSQRAPTATPESEAQASPSQPSSVGKWSVGRRSGRDARPKRQAIPMSTLRAVLGRAGGRCEYCGSDGPLHFHHPLPVCEGGGNDAADLKLACQWCHHGEHLKDFETKEHWARARTAAIERKVTNKG